MTDDQFKRYCTLLLKQLKNKKLSPEDVKTKLKQAKQSLFKRISPLLTDALRLLDQIETDRNEVDKIVASLNLDFWERVADDDPEACPQDVHANLLKIRTIALGLPELPANLGLPDVSQITVLVENEEV
jgi:hypothetical protein